MNGHDRDKWIQTFTGQKFYPLYPEDSNYVIEDIAHALSNICRFTGHCRHFYSVAQHSVILSRLVPTHLEKAALLHDASEAYLTDIARPIKALPSFAGYKIMEANTQTAICKAFGIPVLEAPVLKDFDTLLLRNEAKCLGLLTEEWDHYNLRDLGLEINPLNPEQAEVRFLDAWRELKGA